MLGSVGPWPGRAAIALAGGLAWLLLGVLHQGAERYVAIDNVCAWPNLTLMPDGSVVATIFKNETALLRLRPDRWLAASRSHGDGHLALHVSEDEGNHWKRSGLLTLPGHHPAHLLELADGRILLTYGIREKGHHGIGYRTSEDEGRTWSRPTRIVNLEETTDGGYPSTVQMADGTLLTAYYSNRVSQHQRYHMGAVRWALEKE